MPAPVEGITLADKLAITRHLSAAGANIEQLNAVRKQLSRIKEGGLLRACRAGRLVSLIISDVLGDPLDIIASGPTVPDTLTPQAALDVLERFGALAANVAPAAIEYLERACATQQSFSRRVHASSEPGVDAGAKRESDIGTLRDEIGPKFVRNIILANNATAVAAAAKEAKRLGYSVASGSATHAEGPAEEIARDLVERALKMRAGAGPRVGAAVQLPPQQRPTCRRPLNDSGGAPSCFISGGEPVVKLVESSRRGLGGRNQQLVLAALLRLRDDGADGIALLSGGTDGEDGPTDAAGALLDADVLAAAREKNLDPADFLARNDAYHFFEPLAALVKTGPTQTNVCDVRVMLCGAKPQAANAKPRAVV